MSYGVKLYYTQCTVQPDRKRPPGARIAAFFSAPTSKTGAFASDLDPVVVLNVSSLCSKLRQQSADQHRDVISELLCLTLRREISRCIARLKGSGILFLLVALRACQPHCLHQQQQQQQVTHSDLLKNALTKSSLFCFMI